MGASIGNEKPASSPYCTSCTTRGMPAGLHGYITTNKTGLHGQRGKGNDRIPFYHTTKHVSLGRERKTEAHNHSHHHHIKETTSEVDTEKRGGAAMTRAAAPLKMYNLGLGKKKGKRQTIRSGARAR